MKHQGVNTSVLFFLCVCFFPGGDEAVCVLRTTGGWGILCMHLPALSPLYFQKLEGILNWCSHQLAVQHKYFAFYRSWCFWTGGRRAVGGGLLFRWKTAGPESGTACCGRDVAVLLKAPFYEISLYVPGEEVWVQWQVLLNEDTTCALTWRMYFFWPLFLTAAGADGSSLSGDPTRRQYNLPVSKWVSKLWSWAACGTGLGSTSSFHSR